MRLEPGQVAVVTGAASGIGRGLVDAFAARGLVVVLADVEERALDRAAAEVTSTGARVLGACVDVRDPAAVEALAARVMSELGRIDVVCNNAGVVTPRAPVWQQSYADWLWTVQVNLLGVANGVRAFVPHLVEAQRGHVVNTSSIAGLATIPGGGNGAYSATKHAVVGLSETLRLELALVAPEVGVTVLCPGPVPSRIHDAARNRPGGPGDRAQGADALPKPDFGLALEAVPAGAVAAQVLGAIEAGREYVLTAPDIVPMARDRAQHLLNEL